MRIYKIIAVGLISFLLFSDQAMAKSPGGLLKDIRKRYKKIQSLRADYREIFEWAMTGEKNLVEGKLVVTADNRFRIDNNEQLLVSDGKDIYRWNRLQNQLIIESIASSEEPLLPQRLLLEFADGFKAVESSELPVAERAGYRLDLVPEDPETMLLSEVILWCTSEDQTIHRMKIIDLNGNSTTYLLSGIIIDRQVPECETSFSPPKGVEIFDLR